MLFSNMDENLSRSILNGDYDFSKEKDITFSICKPREDLSIKDVMEITEQIGRVLEKNDIQYRLK